MARHELKLELMLAALRASVWRCWKEPQLLVQWFAPKPWATARASLDVRPGGATEVVMRSPDGQEFPSGGVYLDVVPGERLVFTDAFTAGWEPSAKAFMTGILTFADAPGGGTRYVARALHWNEDDKTRHESMGFHAGWTKAAEQLDALALTL